ncbi:hypothetical protein ICN46_07905 [Polynucleobacter sp. Latsch14-2]|uniref:hypothetical protein n=1 Tax=Polynucleobacter sp. Latsch14-2 TaxID=2576920 RepID=UPI001C0DF9DD|nr:hypothetical protein [Polynucleobacter sp. Latsch14-2]MBU3614817.1 hypothetical protein [Polynucleobacter sp. Latsch14-2]
MGQTMQIQYLTSKELAVYENGPLLAGGVLVAMPFTNADHAQRAAKLMASRASAPGMILCIHDQAEEGFIALINRAFVKTQSAYFAYVAQDALAGRDWLKEALTAMGDRKNFLGFNDGKWAGALAGFGLARRSWATQNYGGDFFYPAYKRHYADAELTLLAMQADAYAYEPNSLLVEVDWDKDASAVDADDRSLFLERKKKGFDGRVSNPTLLNHIK